MWTEAPSAGGVRRCLQGAGRAHRTHVEEFSDFYDGELTMGPLTVGPLNRALREREAYHNAERWRQSLGWLRPMGYLAEQRLRDGLLPPPPRCLIGMGRVQPVDIGDAPH